MKMIEWGAVAAATIAAFGAMFWCGRIQQKFDDVPTETGIRELESRMTVKLIGLIPADVSVPIGTIVAWHGSKDQFVKRSGGQWLVCDGETELDPTQHATLIALLGKTKVPNLRGRFLRGYEKGVTEAIGLDQEDAIQALKATTVGTPPDWVDPSDHMAKVGAKGGTSQLYRERIDKLPDEYEVRSAGETRPKNIAVVWIIKAR